MRLIFETFSCLSFKRSELERNFNVIQDLQFKLQSMNTSGRVAEPQEDPDQPLIKKSGKYALK